MRQRRIFDIIVYLNSIHFVLQNERLFVCFVYRIQMLSRCEIDEIAKRIRNIRILISMQKFCNLIRFDFNSESSRQSFF